MQIIIANGLLLILIVVRLVIGLQLFAAARRNRLTNLNWLGAFFIFNFLGVPFATALGNPLGNLPAARWIFNGLLTSTAMPCLMAFIHTTFYTQRRSPLGWLGAVTAGLCAIGFYGLALSPANDQLSPWVAAFYVLNGLIWSWHVAAAYEAYRAIAADRTVEEWIKARYQLMIWSAVFNVVSAGANILRVTLTHGEFNTPLGNITGLVSFGGIFLNIGLQFIIWVIPEQFRLWLNRAQQRQAAEQAAHQADMIFRMLSKAMTTNTGLTEFFAGYALRTVVSRQLGTQDPAQIDQRVARLGYHEWLAVLNNAELQRLCADAGANIDAQQVVQNALQALQDRQALFTMQAQ